MSPRTSWRDAPPSPPGSLPSRRWRPGSGRELLVVAFDTNVVVRLLLRDDAAQAKKAEQAFLRHARGDGVFLPLVVLVETAWVLAYTYQLDRKAIHEHLLALSRTRGVVVDEADLVQDALDAYA